MWRASMLDISRHVKMPRRRRLGRDFHFISLAFLCTFIMGLFFKALTFRAIKIDMGMR